MTTNFLGRTIGRDNAMAAVEEYLQMLRAEDTEGKTMGEIAVVRCARRPFHTRSCAEGRKCILAIVAVPGAGKTHFIDECRHVLDLKKESAVVLVCTFNSGLSRSSSPDDVELAWPAASAVAARIAYAYFVPHPFWITQSRWDRFRQAWAQRFMSVDMDRLLRLVSKEKPALPVLLAVDEIGKAAQVEATYRVVANCTSYPGVGAMITAFDGPRLVRAFAPTSESDRKIKWLHLRPLDIEAVRTVFAQAHIHVEAKWVQLLEEYSGGHPRTVEAIYNYARRESNWTLQRLFEAVADGGSYNFVGIEDLLRCAVLHLEVQQVVGDAAAAEPAGGSVSAVIPSGLLRAESAEVVRWIGSGLLLNSLSNIDPKRGSASFVPDLSMFALHSWSKDSPAPLQKAVQMLIQKSFQVHARDFEAFHWAWEGIAAWCCTEPTSLSALYP